MKSAVLSHTRHHAKRPLDSLIGNRKTFVFFSRTESRLKHQPSIRPWQHSTLTTMAASNTTSAISFLSDIKARRTHYDLAAKSPIPDARIEEIVKEALTHVPSAFNVQSARAVVLFGDHHRKLWELGAKHMKAILPADKWAYFEGKIKGMGAAYGTVMFFEDQEALDALAAKNPLVQAEVAPWSQNSAGMHHFAVWTALALEGLPGNLQHYNMVPPFAQEVNQTWNLPETWKLNAQLVFGTPNSPAGEKTHLPIEPRFKTFA